MRFKVAYASTPRRPSLRLQRERIADAVWVRRWYTSFYLPSQKFPGTFRGICTGRRRFQYLRHACREYCPYPPSIVISWRDPPSYLLRPGKGSLWACPSPHVRRYLWYLCRFWVRHAHAWEWRPCLQDRWPHNGYCCVAPWWTPSSCSWGHTRCQISCCIHSDSTLYIRMTKIIENLITRKEKNQKHNCDANILYWMLKGTPGVCNMYTVDTT